MRDLRHVIGPALLLAGALALVTASLGAQRGHGRRNAIPDFAASRTAQPTIVTPRQREDAQARIALATEILSRFQAEATARGLSANWRQPAFETLLPLSRQALERVWQRAVNLDALAPAVSEAANDPNLLGDTDED